TAGTPDTGLSRGATGAVYVGNGTQGDFTGSLKLANVNVVATTTTLAGSAFTVTNNSSTGRAYFSTVNDLGNSFGMEVVGSTAAALPNSVFIFTQDVGTALTQLAFCTNGGVATGGTTPISFLAGGYGVTPQLKILTTGALQIGGTDTSLSRYSAGVIAAGTGAAASYAGTFLASQFAMAADTTSKVDWTDVGLSRLAAGSLALGNGTAGDFSGSLKLTTLTLAGLSASELVATNASKTLVSVTAVSVIGTVPRVTKSAGYTATASDYVMSFTAT